VEAAFVGVDRLPRVWLGRGVEPLDVAPGERRVSDLNRAGSDASVLTTALTVAPRTDPQVSGTVAEKPQVTVQIWLPVSPWVYLQ
jgi:hypothetical protein